MRSTGVIFNTNHELHDYMLKGGYHDDLGLPAKFLQVHVRGEAE
ncbi:hypothetical protein Metho_0875 [Methanomethylovorans hollandica DSM 15978]|uniref:Uncharacterized protein n=1 Tax=Methanomethylovorans hollandica (strain DSM 15978 / NBRC 107637 / DMS1) TaxID=867904 RepID=L0KYG5_METHD|nr:hypothetical protein [Methanomethylovorans hollandica]AGB49118.1 hypothetical protein Metho_0875 [Methanomethylovorans hollandica DSM 15978]